MIIRPKRDIIENKARTYRYKIYTDNKARDHIHNKQILYKTTTKQESDDIRAINTKPKLKD